VISIVGAQPLLHWTSLAHGNRLYCFIFDHFRSSAAPILGPLALGRFGPRPLWSSECCVAAAPIGPPRLGPLRLRHLGLLCSGRLGSNPSHRSSRLGIQGSVPYARSPLNRHPRIGPSLNRTLPPLRSSRSGPRSLSAPGRLGLSGARPARLCSPRLLQSWAFRSSVAPVLQCSISRPLCNSTISPALTPHRRSA